MSTGQRQFKRDHQAQVHSDKMVLLMARQGGWTVLVVAKRHSKLKSQGGQPGLGPLRSDGSRGSQAGRLYRVNGS